MVPKGDRAPRHIVTSSAELAESDARDLLSLANEDPATARPRALELLTAALDDGNDRIAAIAGRAAGLSEAYVGDLSVSVGYLEAAADAARRAGDTDLEGETEMTLGAVRCWAGENTAGLRSLDRAIAMLSGAERARALVQRGSVRYRAAEFEASLADFDAAEAPLRDAGDEMWLAHLLNNRGLSRAYRGSLPDAEADLEQALEIYTGLGHRFSVAQMHHNLGWVAAQLGDVPRALGRFDEAEVEYVQLGSQPAELFRDRSSALISVHLAEEAFSTAMRAAELLERDGHAAGRAEALVRAADAALLAERYDEALACAEEAQSAFAAQQRSGWAQYAEVIALRARGGRGDIEPARWRRASQIADALGSAGLQSGAAAARVLAADLAVVAGDHDAARAQMEQVRLTPATAAIDLRAEAWYVTARLRLAQDDRRGAARAVDAGLRVVEHHQATLGATETRAHAAGHAKRLAALGVQLAWNSARPRRILRWLERTRAGTLRFPPVRVPDDAALAGDLAELRLVDRQQRSVEIAPAEESRLRVRRRRLEAEIQRRTRRASGGVSRASAADVDQLLAELGSRALVEYGRVGEHLVMLTAIDGVVRRHTGPRIAEVVNSIDMLRVGLARLAHGRGSDASRAAARATVLAAAGELSGMLLEPLRLGDRELVLVPPPALHAMAWGLLPAAVGRPIAVSPSAELWLRRRGPVRVSRPVLLAGPRLPEAPAEIAAVSEVYDDAATFDPATGSVAAVRAALERCGLAHLACHGRFRADNPLFSALEFSDGWFTVYDFEGLSSVPDLMVLSACDAGLSAERPGDEVMGIVAGLLGAGARAVVASVGLVPDSDGTREVMVDFHRRLAAGERVGVALASAQEQASRAGDLASASFVCFGYS